MKPHFFAWSLAPFLFVSSFLLGCHTTTIRSGRLPDPRPAAYHEGPEAIVYDGRWHHGFINGIVESGGNYNLQRICPNGWAEVTTETDFLNVLVHMFTAWVYTPQSVTIRCAAVAAPGAYPPNIVPPYAVPPIPPPPPPPPTPAAPRP